jgi:transcription-repair coupling factor (superfamily II helicase)
MQSVFGPQNGFWCWENAKIKLKGLTVRRIVTQKIIKGFEPFEDIIRQIRDGAVHLSIGGLQGSAGAFAVSVLYGGVDRPLLVVCAEEKDAAAFARDLKVFLGNEAVLHYPALDFLTVDMFALQREEELARLEVLAELQVGPKAVVVASVQALMQKVMPLDVFTQSLSIVSVKDVIDRDRFGERLMSAGYRQIGLVEEKGEFSFRGNIVDVFPPAEKLPLRLEMSGDEVESIRRFDPGSQRSVDEIGAFVLSPAREILINSSTLERAVRNVRRRADELSISRETRNRFVETLNQNLTGFVNPLFLPLFYETYNNAGGLSTDKLSSLFDYLPGDTLIVLDGYHRVHQAMENVHGRLDKLLFKTKNSGKFYLEKETTYWDTETVARLMEGKKSISLDFLDSDHPKGAAAVRLETQRYLFAGELRPGEIREEAHLRWAADWIRESLARRMMIFLCCSTPEALQRMKHLLEAKGLSSFILQGKEDLWEQINQNGDGTQVFLLEGEIGSGFIFPAMKLVFLSEEDIFVKKAPRRRSRPFREGYFLKSFGELKEGDFVVHKDFGIGIYRGLKKISVGNIENDFLAIEYADADKLYIPVNALDRIQRYVGPDGYVPKVDKMGGTSWEAAKERVRRSVREYAEELVAVYAAREVLERKPYAPPDGIYEEFCSTFEFEETPDQLKAIEDVHQDMDAIKPMDRLVCGDAGFGKTEVAIRAAFRAVMDGKQVAVLVPTTILAEQHYQTFARRFRDFPVRVEVLNRFKSAAEQKKILQDLASQRVDIVVGTHRLLQKDVVFRELGLVIIDEEQRFGVSHKEKLKKMRTLVDVLTLSATPIPRTLHLSLVGIRDLSVINTPPEDRTAVKTYVLEFSEEAIRSAIENELSRRGQVFFVHDRVRSIYAMARLVQKLVPQARVGIVHGQMRPADIEKAMAAFIRQECDVLVCTTIIGSGLDIPTANTIIINRAEKFGLAQLYQIRGRVGRSNQEAVAYLLLPKGAMLSREAMKRLQVIKELSEPGSGFRIAYNDLEIRGGGNLLGVSQSGHISAVGYELYTELMEKTIREIKGEKIEEEEPLPEIQLGFSAYIPEEYVPDVHQRLVWYKRIALAQNDEEIFRIREALRDCYGEPPSLVDNLLKVIKLRNRVKPFRVRKMGYDGKYLYIGFREDSPVEPGKMIALLRGKNKGWRFTPDFRLYYPAPSLTGDEILAEADRLLKMLAHSS